MTPTFTLLETGRNVGTVGYSSGKKKTDITP